MPFVRVSGFCRAAHAQLRASDWVRFRSLWRWTTLGFWAVADQALFAVGNFVLNVLLARWLDPREYGGFVLSYSIFLLLGVAHSAVLIEPMFVYGPSRYADDFVPYVKRLMRYHWRFSVLAAVALGLTGLLLVWGDYDLLGRTFVGLSVVTPLLLANWLLRRACYVVARPELAAMAGAVYLVLALAGAAALLLFGFLSVLTVQIVMGVSALIAGLLIYAAVTRDESGRRPGLDARAVWLDHWNFGRWSIGSGVLLWSQGHLFYVMLPIVSGLEGTAALRALVNLVMPALQADSALVTLLGARYARLREEPVRFDALVRLSQRLFAVEGVLIWCVLALCHQWLVPLVYGPRYAEHSSLLVLLGALPLLASRVNILGAALRALERPDQVFWATGTSAVISVCFAWWAITVAGVRGAALATVIASAVHLVLLRYYLRRAPRAQDRLCATAPAVADVSPR